MITYAPKRYILLEVSDNADPGRVIQFRPQDFLRNPLRLGIHDLRISFRVEYFADSLDYTGYISVFNTNANKWKNIPRYEILSLYSDFYRPEYDFKSKPPLIFRGSIAKLKEKIYPTYNEIKIEVSSTSLLRKSFETFEFSREGEVTLIDLLKELCKSIGLTLQTYKAETRGTPGLFGMYRIYKTHVDKILGDIKFKDYTISGNPYELLKKFLHDISLQFPDLSYTIFDNKVHIYDNTIGTEQAFDINSLKPNPIYRPRVHEDDRHLQIDRSSGMILAPEIDDLGQGRFFDDTNVRVRSVFNPVVRIGNIFKVTSKETSGTYVVNYISHNIDNFTGKFESSFSLRRKGVPNVSAA